MLALFNFFKKFLRLFVDFAMVIQIVVAIVLFTFIMYWFFDLINFQILAFLTPVANNITVFMHSYFEESLNKGVNETDGSLFLFVMFLFVVIGALSQLKIYTVSAENRVSRKIDKIKSKNEDEFNAQLRAEADQAILAYRNVVLIVKLTAYKRTIDDMRTDEEKEKNIKKWLTGLFVNFTAE